MCSYKIPAEISEKETLVKKSRFIARAGKVTSKEEARLFLKQAQKDFPDARHHCWAYLLGNPAVASSAAMHDAGEPSGTAGKPILNVIQHKKIGDVMVVVIRYFGGIKLGAGGLTRAYSGAAESVLSALKLTELELKTDVTLKLGFDNEQAVRHWLENNKGNVTNVEYGNVVKLKAAVADDKLATLRDFCAGRGIQISEDQTLTLKK